MTGGVGDFEKYLKVKKIKRDNLFILFATCCRFGGEK